jgi:hypothetical protein
MNAIILPDGNKFAIWVDGELMKDGFPNRIEAAFWANEQGYSLS